MNVKETKEMLDLAKEKNLFLMEAIWSRVQPSYLKLKEEIDKGLIGEVSHVQAKLYIPSTYYKNSNESCTFAIFGQIGFLSSSENLCNFAEASYFLRVVFSYFHEKKK